MWLKILPIIFLAACANTQNNNMDGNIDEDKPQDINRLHDIWVLESMNGEDLPKDLIKAPTIEIFVKDKRMAGNDGCNNMSGPIKDLSETKLSFGTLIGTKMACPNMVFSRSLNTNLSSTRQFKLKGLRLVLQNENGDELLVYKKVD